MNKLHVAVLFLIFFLGVAFGAQLVRAISSPPTNQTEYAEKLGACMARLQMLDDALNECAKDQAGHEAPDAPELQRDPNKRYGA